MNRGKILILCKDAYHRLETKLNYYQQQMLEDQDYAEYYEKVKEICGILKPLHDLAGD
ncbi:MAG: hypothetical protein PHQ23_13930 [Candidatus Wallbacteria bacterium]|nr:hypothetical protein [Candidatus Wallbacteria bacterium]